MLPGTKRQSILWNQARRGSLRVRPRKQKNKTSREGLLCRSPSRLVSVWVGSNQQKLCFSAELFDLPLSPHCFRFAVKDLAVDQMYWAAGTSIYRSSAGINFSVDFIYLWSGFSLFGSSAGIVGCQTPL